VAAPPRAAQADTNTTRRLRSVRRPIINECSTFLQDFGKEVESTFPTG
jgi:hypothetical protein